ncbi:hypothetical protein POTOM_004847 [Populus tomentosa]|uniref:Bifunctional inhibitor/plant lipid transfer protein/seed storage helical domain-containing protein n=1 Tax=Populus tomentosa TaxID=118781 RepID=A0A8X8AVW1_POPTO|nr:hypothetical protein POTOM_004847 [Populus tomentosa]
MASKSTTSLALFLAVNLLFFSLVTAKSSSCPPPPKPKPTPSPTPNPSGGKCPKDALKLGVCADLLGSLLNVTVGTPPVKPCCSVIQGLLDLEAAVCLCTAIKANILGINLNIPVSLSLLLNVCGKKGSKENGMGCLVTRNDFLGDGAEDDPRADDCKTSIPTSREVLGQGESNGSLEKEIGTEELCSIDGEEEALL